MRDERFVPLAGPANFRDMGGYPTADGRSVRTGGLFRSDSLATMTTDDVAHCVERLGIRTVIDLRAGHELDRFSHVPLRDAGVTFRHLPIVDETRPPAQGDEPRRRAWREMPPTLDAVYLLMLDRFRDRFAAVISVLADPSTHPLVFHCAAGKDRTGLVAALVLGVLGVPDDVVATDYALSEQVMSTLMERHRDHAERRGLEPEVAVQHFVAEERAMLGVLAGLRQRHGSVADYLRAAGVTDEAIGALREAMLA